MNKVAIEITYKNNIYLYEIESFYNCNELLMMTRTVTEVFKPITTNPQLEAWWTNHGYQESIHSDSYAELIKALPINSNKVFDFNYIPQNNDNLIIEINEFFSPYISFIFENDKWRIGYHIHFEYEIEEIFKGKVVEK